MSDDQAKESNRYFADDFERALGHECDWPNAIAEALGVEPGLASRMVAIIYKLRLDLADTKAGYAKEEEKHRKTIAQYHEVEERANKLAREGNRLSADADALRAGLEKGALATTELQRQLNRNQATLSTQLTTHPSEPLPLDWVDIFSRTNELRGRDADQAKEIRELKSTLGKKDQHIKEISDGWERTHQANQKHQHELAEAKSRIHTQKHTIRGLQRKIKAVLSALGLDPIGEPLGESPATPVREYTCDNSGHAYMGKPRMCARCGKMGMETSENITEGPGPTGDLNPDADWMNRPIGEYNPDERSH